MNKIWKSFFSKKLGRFVVASENARSSTKANKSKNSIAVAVAVVGITFSAGALANEVVNSTGSQAFGEGIDILPPLSFSLKWGILKAKLLGDFLTDFACFLLLRATFTASTLHRQNGMSCRQYITRCV